MRCGKVQRWISARLDGALDAKRQALVASHLDGCPECRAFAADLPALDSLLAAVEVAEPRWGFEARVMARIANEAEPGSLTRVGHWCRSLRPAPVGVGAAAFAAGIALVVLANGEAPSNGEPHDDAVAVLASGVLGVTARPAPEDDWVNLFSRSED